MYNKVLFLILTLAILTVKSAPFLDLTGSGSGTGGLLNKVQGFCERVYNRNRDFVNGINEKVSTVLLIPPLPSKNNNDEDEIQQFNMPLGEEDRLVYSTRGLSEKYTEPKSSNEEQPKV
ncbi:uncharacterized protein LOC129748926 [Uranotaenia lowii]|uniref:uncharacterized protein LOC129748926 n=1 Tax=Uranotaenia lowii TaxID=190385 RepID=UPI00247A0130|nr:uncharacterized protein LOC129748926 [Uranotaenia lowii]